MTNNLNNLSNKSIFVTGSAGFIGSNVVLKLLQSCEPNLIVGIDNLNDYYDPNLKQYRLSQIEQESAKHPETQYKFIKADLADRDAINKIFADYKFDIVVNLAAQAGVRYSIENPDAYINSNIIGFYNILEACRYANIEHLVYASSSSVYGDNEKVPFSVEDKTDNPVSLYAATKKSDELLAYAYSKLYNIPTTGLRFFTVYGPAGRPDMAYYKFTNKLINNEKIQIFNYGKCKRDFTFIDDITEGIVRVMLGKPGAHKLYNIGNQNPVELTDFVRILGEELIVAGILPEDFDIESHMELVPMQPGDVETTFADTSALEHDYGYKPSTDLRTGLRQFANWYKEYYK